MLNDPEEYCMMTMEELEHSRNMYMKCLNRLEDFVAEKGLIDEFQKWKKENNR